MELNGLALVFKLTEEEDNKCSISVEFFRDGGGENHLFGCLYSRQVQLLYDLQKLCRGTRKHDTN